MQRSFISIILKREELSKPRLFTTSAAKNVVPKRFTESDIDAHRDQTTISVKDVRRSTERIQSFLSSRSESQKWLQFTLFASMATRSQRALKLNSDALQLKRKRVI